MALTPGTRIGSYEIAEQIGAGGMGEVYRATDTRLGRQVAIKVLPETVAQDAERLARFEREARTLASLNHPNIATLHGLETSDGTTALVMELVEGPTLADRIAQGPIPVDEALPIAKQIAEALEAAHEQGIIHRDLKPANIKLRPDGTVKVLDFGLAKAVAPASAPRASAWLSESPTITTPAITQAGLILGTAAYMSPEHAKGQPADRRADIWALGCVLFEMLTGRRAFDGQVAAEVMASVLNAEPDYSTLQASLDPRVVTLLRRCLEKAARNRWQSVGEIRYQLEQIVADPEAPGISPVLRSSPSKRRSAFTWAAVATIAGVAAGATTMSWLGESRQNPSAPTWATGAIRLSVFPPEGTVIDSPRGYSFAVSPDGTRLVFAGIDRDGTRRLWMQSLALDAAQPISGSDGAWSPFWSADSTWIGFFANRGLRRVRPTGGTPETIAGLHVGADFGPGLATWSLGGVILADGGDQTGLLRIAPQTGAVTRATEAGARDDSPSFLSDGNRFLYLDRTGGQQGRFSLRLGSLDGRQPRQLTEEGNWSRFAWVPGFVLFVRDHTLFARAFDEDEAVFTAQEARVIDGIPMSPGVTPFSVSRNGVLAYWQNAVGYDTAFEWVDRRGRPTPIVTEPGRYSGFALSPDGTRIVLSRKTPDGLRDIWVDDLTRGGEEKRTFDGDSLTPIWSTDGGRIAFSSSRGGPPHVFVRAVDGTADQAVTAVGQLQFARSLHGNDLVYEEIDNEGWSDLWVVHLNTGDTRPLPINTPFNESYGRISSDGRHLAYVTDSSGQEEVRLATFPTVGNSVPVSVGGGSFPEWRADGRELYYVSRTRQLMRVAITGDDENVRVGIPERLFRFENVIDTYDRDSQFYAPAPDGQRFLVAARADVPQPPIRVIVNWPALLEE